MALQTRGADPRLYNPDRDMLWAMPRLMKNALMQFGEKIAVKEVRELLSTRGIILDCSDEIVYHNLETVIQDFAKYLNDLKDNVDVRRNPDDIHHQLFTTHEDKRVYAAIRTLVADFFMSAIYAELPIWFESVQPEKANNPAPAVEEVENTVNRLLAASRTPDTKNSDE